VRTLLRPPPNLSDADASVASALTLTVVGVVTQGVARFGFGILVGRIAGKDLLGESNLALSLGTFLVLCWPQASGTAASKYIAMARGARDARQQAAVAAYTARLAAGSAAVLSVVAVVIAATTLGLDAAHSVQTGLFVLSLSAYNYVRGVRAGNNAFVTSAAWDAISASISLTLTLLVLLADWPTLVLIPLIVGYMSYAIAGWPRAGGSPSAALRWEIVSFVAWATVHVVAAGGLLQLTMLLVSRHATSSELGDYAAALTLATPAGLLAIVLRTALAPTVARMFAAGDLAGVRRRVDSMMRAMVAIFVPVFGVGILWSHTLLRVGFGDRFVGGSRLLVLLLLGVSFTAINASHLRLIGTVHSGVRTLAACNVFGLVCGVTVLEATAPDLGVEAGAWGYLVGSAISWLIAMAVVWRMDRMRWHLVVARMALGYSLALAGTAYVDDSAVARPALATAVLLLCWMLVSGPDIRAVFARRSGFTQ